jgi:hypothetical protein
MPPRERSRYSKAHDRGLGAQATGRPVAARAGGIVGISSVGSLNPGSLSLPETDDRKTKRPTAPACRRSYSRVGGLFSFQPSGKRRLLALFGTDCPGCRCLFVGVEQTLRLRQRTSESDPSAALGSTQESARSHLIGGMVRRGRRCPEPTRLCSTAAARQRRVASRPDGHRC